MCREGRLLLEPRLIKNIYFLYINWSGYLWEKESGVRSLVKSFRFKAIIGFLRLFLHTSGEVKVADQTGCHTMILLSLIAVRIDSLLLYMAHCQRGLYSPATKCPPLLFSVLGRMGRDLATRNVQQSRGISCICNDDAKHAFPLLVANPPSMPWRFPRVKCQISIHWLWINEY